MWIDCVELIAVLDEAMAAASTEFGGAPRMTHFIGTEIRHEAVINHHEVFLERFSTGSVVVDETAEVGTSFRGIGCHRLIPVGPIMEMNINTGYQGESELRR